MKTWKVSLVIVMICAVLLLAFSNRKTKPVNKKPFVPPKGCVFRTVMGEEPSDS